MAKRADGSVTKITKPTKITTRREVGRVGFAIVVVRLARDRGPAP